MEKFLKDILSWLMYFVLLPGLLVTGLYIWGASKHQFPPKGYYYNTEFEEAFNERKGQDIVLLGNSKSLSALSPELMEEQLNMEVAQLGFSSSNMSVTRLILESYLNRAEKAPEVVCLEVSWFSFNQERTHFHRVIGDLLMEDYSLVQYGRRYPKLLTIGFEKMLASCFNSESSSPKNYDERIAGMENDPSVKSYTLDMENIRTVFPDSLAGIDEVLLEDFETIVTMCKNRGVELVLFTAPEDAEYAALQKDIESIKTLFKEKASEKTITYLDYSPGGDLYRKDYENWLENADHIFHRDLFTGDFIKALQNR